MKNRREGQGPARAVVPKKVVVVPINLLIKHPKSKFPLQPIFSTTSGYEKFIQFVSHITHM